MFIFKKINISNFNTNYVTDMSLMFYGCSSLEEIDISNLNVDNVICIDKMFSGCSNELKLKIKAQNVHITAEAFNEENDEID